MLTVLLATYNGDHVLDKVLNAYTRLQEPKGGWKLVIVNNASTDRTSSILENFTTRLPLTILFEGRRGKTIALNTGLTKIEGDVVVMTDDDIIPPPDWLLGWRETVDGNPDVSIFGGKIAPYWESPPPDWILKSISLGLAFAITPDDLPAGEVNPGMIWGGNMAVRANIFAKGLRYDEQIGPAAGKYIMGDETDFNRRVAAMGNKCMYFPEIQVQHIIRSYQLNETWLLDRAFRHGKMRAQITKTKENENISMLAGYPRWMLKDLIIQFASLGWNLLTKNRSAAFKAKWRIYEIQGFLAEFKALPSSEPHK